MDGAAARSCRTLVAADWSRPHPEPLRPSEKSRRRRRARLRHARACRLTGRRPAGAAQHHLSRWSGPWSASVNGVAWYRIGSRPARATRFLPGTIRDGCSCGATTDATARRVSA